MNELSFFLLQKWSGVACLWNKVGRKWVGGDPLKISSRTLFCQTGPTACVRAREQTGQCLGSDGVVEERGSERRTESERVRNHGRNYRLQVRTILARELRGLLGRGWDGGGGGLWLREGMFV